PQSFALALASIFLGTTPQRRGKDGLALGPDRFHPPTQTLPSLGRAMMTQPNTVIVCKVGQGAEPL
ncbi:hypothetical protein L5220_13810, partial [Synechococcus sp. PCC 6716]|nr:hypothetical protein [Synechococcus sp. PCC 6716]